MVIAAFVVSCLAFLASVGSVWYTRRQSGDARITRQIEQARRRDELEPDFEAWVESKNDGGWHRLCLKLRTPRPLMSVSAAAPDGDEFRFTHGQDGVDAARSEPVREARFGALRRGDQAAWVVELQREHASTTTVWVHCGDHEYQWSVLVTVTLPFSPNIY